MSEDIQEDPCVSIQFKQITRTDVDGPWPQFTKITLNILTNRLPDRLVSITDTGKILFTVDSGWARYRLDVEQDSEYYLRLVLEETGK